MKTKTLKLSQIIKKNKNKTDNSFGGTLKHYELFTVGFFEN